MALGEAPSTGFAAGGGRRFPAPRPLPQAAGGRGMMRGGAHPAPVLKRLRPGPAAAYGAPDLVVTVGRRLYVSNLAYGTTWQNLKDHFAQAGAVVYANVMQGPDGRSKARRGKPEAAGPAQLARGGTTNSRVPPPPCLRAASRGVALWSTRLRTRRSRPSPASPTLNSTCAAQP